jgi:CTP:molybdopterin cytidylyltransferase MocA
MVDCTGFEGGDSSSSRPGVSVVLSTYNRAAQVGRAVDSVLSQSGVDLELVVVDDGSTDDTPAVLAAVADARMRCVSQRNQGLSASRNAGARQARGDWLLFLDDDDRLCEGALERLLTARTGPFCRVVVGGMRFVDGHGQMLEERSPASLRHVLAGSFLISRSLFEEVGGYLEGLPTSHQTELFLRVRQVLGGRVGAASFIADPVVEIERRGAGRRPQRSPANAYFGGRWIAVRHPDQYPSRSDKATIETITAVNAMRIGREAEARRRMATAIRLDPLSPGRYVRLAGAVLTPVGRRFWLRQWDAVPAAQRPLDRLQRPADRQSFTGGLPLERDPNPGPDSLFLPWRYRENPAAPGPVENELGDEAQIVRIAARLARSKGLEPVVEIGCGFSRRRAFEWRCVGGDLDDEAVWAEVSRLKPQLVLCADIVQRVSDPRRLLSGIRHAVRGGGLALISTPDRNRLRPKTPLGPPRNPGHIREWSADEFGLLLESCGFGIRRIRRLRRAFMAFLVQAV